MLRRLLIIFLLLPVTYIFAQATTLEKVSVQLKWKHQFQFAGFYMAKEKGFYKDLGLDVEFLEYELSQDIVSDVLSSKSEYGVAYSSVILSKIENKEIILLNAFLQSSPQVLVSLKSSNIKTVEDFKNKKIMIADAATYSTSFISMLHSHGVSFSDMIRFDPDDDVKRLLKKEVDIISAYRSNQVYRIEKSGVKYNIWDPKDYGFDFYDDILFTSKKEFLENPQRVERFREATLRGFAYAYENIEETINVIQKKYNTQNKTEDTLRYEAKTLKKLAYRENKNFGDIDPVKIQRIIDIYNLFGHIKVKVDLENFIHTSKNSLLLSAKEKEYLYNKKTIRMCVDPNWMPFEEILDGKHIGMSADYFELIKSKLPVEIKLVQTSSWDESISLAKQRKCDIMSLVMPTPQREKYLNFTDSYIKIPLVMATKNNAPFVVDFSSLGNKKIGIAKGYSFLELLRVKYPNLQLIEVNNLKEGLQKVVNGELYGYIGTLATIGYSFQKNFTGELKIAGKFDGTWNLGIGVRHDDEILYGIMQKAVQSIDEREKQSIINDWLAIHYEESIDYEVLFKIVAGFMLVILLMILFYLRERKLKKDIEMNQKLLEAIMDKTPNPMFYKDEHGVFRNVNTAFAKNILSLTKQEVITETFYDLEYLEVLKALKLRQEDDADFFANHLFEEYEATLEVSDSSTKDYKITKTVFRSETGEHLGYIGIMSDITELKNREKKLQLLASVDPLTKLYNRRYFSKMANYLLNLAKRENENISLVMMDIDNFKKINDTYGHKIGDDVIIAISNLLQESSRESDIVARFGGEEFLMLLPKTDIEGADVIAQKIRQGVEDLVLNVNQDEKIRFTISLGISSVDVENEVEIDIAIQRADEALYIAKRSGKNRVCRV